MANTRAGTTTTAPQETRRHPPEAATLQHRPARSRFQSFVERLFQPVDIASLALFRVLFGAIMLWEVWRYFSHGWIERYFIDPTYHFTWYGFHWVQPWPGDWMYVHFALLGVLAACIMLGLFYRIAAPLFFLAFTYVFLLEQARYLNHFYFVCLLSLLLAVVPAHRAFSLDARLRPRIRSETAPTWALWTLRAQVGVVFVYAGVAKLNGDWLHGEPLRMWLASRTDFPVLGRFFTEEWAPYLFSYGGLLFDLFVVAFLLWPRTRPFAFLAAITFHSLNSELFQIGIFPWLALGTALLFFPPDWPRFRRLRARLQGRKLPSERTITPATGPPAGWRPRPAHKVLIGLLSAYLAIQVLVPLRHFVYPGNVSWTEEGHQFSWHMKLRDKAADATIIAVDPASGRTVAVDPTAYLTDWQFSKMSTRPDMILQFAHYLAGEASKRGVPGVGIKAQVTASLNGRAPQLLIDPNVDLTKEKRTPFGGADWIEPLREPLPN